MIRIIRTVMVAAALLLPTSLCVADIPLEFIKHAKLATALVDVEEVDGVAEGSAFCIDSAGLFVTNAHVVQDLKSGGRLMLILHSGEKDQIKFRARVVIQDKQMDLAVLQALRPQNLTTMTLGDTDGLVETVPVAAFGYPFGTDLALKNGEYPSITVSTGHITALRRAAGKLEAIQIDASLNPGNSGGPIIDSNGEVIGIVMEGIPGSGINLAIPVTHLKSLLNRLKILFTPPVIHPGHLDMAHQFNIELMNPSKDPGRATVDLTLTPDGQEARVYHASSVDGKTYSVSAPLLPAEKGAALQLVLEGKGNTLNARSMDKVIRVGTSETALSKVSKILLGPEPQVTLTNGTILRGEISRLPSVDAQIGGAHVTVNAAEFETITIHSNQAAGSVSYHIKAMQGGKLIAELDGKLELGAPAAASVPGAVAGNNNAAATPGVRTPGYEILVTCYDSNDIRRFDAGTGEYLGTLAVGNGIEGPQDMIWGPDGNLYVCAGKTSTILRLNGKTGVFINAFVASGSGGLNNPEGLAWGPDGNLYVSSHWTREVKRYNGKTGEFMGNFISAGAGGLDRPNGLRFGPDGNLYVTSFTANMIKRFNGKTGAFMNDFAGGNNMKQPGMIEFGPNGDLYVCSGSNEIKRYDGKTGQFISNLINAGVGDLDIPLGLCFAQDGKLYVGDKTSTVKRFDLKTGQFLDVFLKGDGMVYPVKIMFRGKPPVR